MSLDAYDDYYSSELNISVTDTEVSDTFGATVDVLSIRPKIDIWVHPTDTSLAGDGATEGRRIFVAQNERAIIPWRASTVFVVNVNATETGLVYCTGWVL